MRRLAWALLLLFVFAIPWEYSLDIGEPLGNVARIAGLVALLAAAPAILLARRVRTPGPVQWLALAFFLWFCCTCFWTIEPHATLARVRAYFQVIMPVWLVWEFAESAEDLRDLLCAYVAGSWVLAALTIASLASPEAAGQVRFVAEGQDPNDVARFLVLGLPMSALLLEGGTRLPGKLLAFAYVPVGLAAVLLTASRGGFLAALIALGGCLLLVGRRLPKRFFAVALSLPVIATAIWFLAPHETLTRITTIPEQLQHRDLNQRMNIWQAGWHAFAHAPFFGTGAGTFVDAARTAPIDTAHNTALAVAVEGGIIALILAAAIVVASGQAVLETKGPVRIALATALLVWVVTSMVATVEQSRSTWFLIAVIALAGRLAAEENQAAESRLPITIGESA